MTGIDPTTIGMERVSPTEERLIQARKKLPMDKTVLFQGDPDSRTMNPPSTFRVTTMDDRRGVRVDLQMEPERFITIDLLGPSALDTATGLLAAAIQAVPRSPALVDDATGVVRSNPLNMLVLRDTEGERIGTLASDRTGSQPDRETGTVDWYVREDNLGPRLLVVPLPGLMARHLATAIKGAFRDVDIMAGLVDKTPTVDTLKTWRSPDEHDDPAAVARVAAALAAAEADREQEKAAADARAKLAAGAADRIAVDLPPLPRGGFTPRPEKPGLLRRLAGAVLDWLGEER